MKKPLFSIGQQVVCVDEFEDASILIGQYQGPLPKKGSIYEVTQMARSEGEVYITLAGFDQKLWLDQEGFAPVQELPDEALAQLIEESLLTPA